VECGVETRDLEKPGHLGHPRTDRSQIVRLVQRRQRHEAFELLPRFGVDGRRGVEVGAAVNDAMTDRDRFASNGLTQPGSDAPHRLRTSGISAAEKPVRAVMAGSRRSVMSIGLTPMPSMRPFSSRSTR
jgi:hypothetical protein